MLSIDTIRPSVSINGGTLDCNNPIITLVASSTSSGLDYLWSGNIDSPLIDTMIIVSNIGSINVMAKDTANGCIGEAQFDVLSDFTEPNIITYWPPNRITCNVPTVQIENVSGNIVNNLWISPTLDSTSNELLIVDAPGIYTYIGTAANGCSRTGTKEIVDDRDGIIINFAFCFKILIAM